MDARSADLLQISLTSGIMVKIGILSDKYRKWQRNPSNVGEGVVVFTNVQTDNCNTSSGDDEDNCVYNLRDGNAN